MTTSTGLPAVYGLSTPQVHEFFCRGIGTRRKRSYNTFSTSFKNPLCYLVALLRCYRRLPFLGIDAHGRACRLLWVVISKKKI